MHLILPDIFLLVADLLDVLVYLENVSKVLHLLLIQLLLTKVNLLDRAEDASELSDEANTTRQVTLTHLQVEPIFVEFLSYKEIIS